VLSFIVWQEYLINKLPPNNKELKLTAEQLKIAQFPDRGTLFVSGFAGTGKTTASVERLVRLSSQIQDPDSILILVAQRSLASPYLRAIRSQTFKVPSPHAILTLGGLAQRGISLFWPIIAQEAGFKYYKKPPVFLTLETAQYYLSQIVDPLLDKRYFEGISVDRLRLYSQILDNLNKSAVVDFPPDVIATRLSAAYTGKSGQTNVFDQAQECALLFRKLCLQNNLLDFSLQIRVFKHHLWKSFLYRQYLNSRFQHLIYDNAEEDYPVAHDVIEDWLPDLQSAIVITDENGGFRTFLGADPISATRFSNLASKTIALFQQFNVPANIQSLSRSLSGILLDHRMVERPVDDIAHAFSIASYRFLPEALEAISAQIKSLIDVNGVSLKEFAILTPYLSDSLLYSTMNRFQALNIPLTAFRPSRGLKDEPAIKAFLTLAKLAFPAYGFIPTREEVRNAFLTSIEDCDLVRADLLAQMLYSTSSPTPQLRVFEPVNEEMRTRITVEIGTRFSRLRKWIIENSSPADQDLDIFLSRLFGELLSQNGFRFHTNTDDAALVSHLIESCRKFRFTLQAESSGSSIEFGKTYIHLIENGILSSQYLPGMDDFQNRNAVLIAPAHSFLMRNYPVKYQYWLDIGSQGWWTRLDQPLTQPYVLNRNWQANTPWTDLEEYSTNQLNLARIINGLLLRCSSHVTMVSIDVNQQGNEERGSLMIAVQNLLKYLHRNGMLKNV
jgi:superfamily I DNA/RNA helicase